MERKDERRVIRKDHYAATEADEDRLEVVEQGLREDEGAKEMAKDVVRKMTSGQDQDVEDEETIEELVGPMHVSDRQELTYSDSPPEDAEAEAEPLAVAQNRG